jgi:hypothetical protein
MVGVINIEVEIKCLQKLKNTHYLIHAHGNNNSPVFNNIPDVIELTYINKKYFKYIPRFNTVSLPILNLDFPNNNQTLDINLNHYPFVNIYKFIFITLIDYKK